MYNIFKYILSFYRNNKSVYYTIGIIYIYLEICNYLRFRDRRKNVVSNLYDGKSGTYTSLLWMYNCLTTSKKPINLEIDKLKKYISTNREITWKDVYTFVRELNSIRHYSIKTHNMLLLITKFLCIKHEIPYDDNYKHPISFEYDPPICTGSTPTTIIYKPLFLSCILDCIAYLSYIYIHMNSYVKHTEYTIDGSLTFYIKKNINSNKTIVLFHGLVYFASAPYIHFFNYFSNYNVIVINLTKLDGTDYSNSRHFSYSNLERAIYNTLLQNNLITAFSDNNDYYFIGHSLGGSIISGLLHESRKLLRPKKIILIEPVCIPHKLISTSEFMFCDMEGLKSIIKIDNNIITSLFYYLFICDINVQQHTNKLTGDGFGTFFKPDTFNGKTLVILSDGDKIVEHDELKDFLVANYHNVTCDTIIDSDHGRFMINKNKMEYVVNSCISFIES
jgi:hypothetical protein